MGNLLLQSKSILQLQSIGAQMKAPFTSNFTDRFYKIIWNPVRPLAVMLTVGLAWQIELAPIFQYKLCATHHILVLWIFACLLVNWVNKISINVNIQMANRGEGSCTSNLHARTSLPNVFSCSVCTVLLALIWYHTCRTKAISPLCKHFWRISVQDSNSVLSDIGLCLSTTRHA